MQIICRIFMIVAVFDPLANVWIIDAVAIRAI